MVWFEWACSVATTMGVALMAKQRYVLAWGVSIAANTAWAAYAGLTSQWGLCALSVLLVLIGAGGLRGVLEPAYVETPIEGFDPGPPTAIPTGPQQGEEKCCQMAAKFITGIGGVRTDVPLPVGAADFIEGWNPTPEIGVQKGGKGIGRTVFFRTRFCPWCGTEDPRYRALRPEDDVA